MKKQVEFSLSPFKRGFHLITSLVEKNLPPLPAEGILFLFIKHTSAGLAINENADATVRQDFETTFNKLIPEDDSYVHDSEGPDDMPAHIKSVMTGNSISVPITNHKLNLGTWQGIYLCEFRNDGGSRKLVATIVA